MSVGGYDFGPEDFKRTARRLIETARGSRRLLLWVGGVVLGLIVIVGSYYQVEPDEVGLVTRFGRYVRTTGPGPHSKIPFGVEQVMKVPVERQLKQEFGFRTERA